MNSLKVFIPAAGIGERLQPITRHIPKPLMPILGKPMLEYVLEKVTALQAERKQIGINLHYKIEEIKDWIYSSAYNKKIQIFPEEHLLGTGGALHNASTFLKHSHFLVHNPDILSDIDLGELVSTHLSSSDAVTLAVHDYPLFNCLLINNHGYLYKIIKTHSGGSLPPFTENVTETAGMKLLAFTGVAVYSPEFLEFLPEGESCVTDAWMKAISGGMKIGTVDVSGCYWNDIGEPASYARAVFDELRKNGETVYIHPTVTWCSDVEFDGYVVIEKQHTSRSFSVREKISSELTGKKPSMKPITLRNCIIFSGPDFLSHIQDDRFIASYPLREADHSHAHVSNEDSNACVENCIAGPDFQVNLSQSDFLDYHEKHDGYFIGTGGSDRKYYRIHHGQDSAVLMESSAQDPDFQRHIEYTGFFRKYGVPVPELIEADAQTIHAVFEDLGDLTLYSWLACQRNPQTIETMYKKIIDIMVILHTTVTEHVSECPMLMSRTFDYTHLRWETDYFFEQFFKGIQKKSIQDYSGLEADLHNLAHTVDSFYKTVIHRDFQSQNIMITKGSVPRMLDYQGARIGPPAYDLVSLLWDPYFRLEDNSRALLLDYYCTRMMRAALWFDGNTLRQSLIPCRLQRHMQALGAFGFLSLRKNKPYFLKFIPEGVRLLRDSITTVQNMFPVLNDLITLL